MERLAKRVTYYLFKNDAISKKDYAAHKYGMQTGLEMLFSMAICTLIAILLNSFTEFMVFVLIFFPLRAYVGGIHLKHFVTCFLFSCSIITFILRLAHLISPPCYLSFVITVAGLLLIWLAAPVSIGYRIQDESEAMFFLKQRNHILTIILLLDVVFLILDRADLSELVMYSTSVALISMILEIIKNRGWEFHRCLKLKLEGDFNEQRNL